VNTLGTGDRRRLPIAFAVYAVWAGLTLFGMRWASDGTPRPLADTVSHGVSWNLVMALAALALATWAMGWRDLKFVAPRPWSSLKLLWFPSLYLVAFGTMGVMLGLPPASTLVFLLINTVLVGLSEEWMFRGVLFQALRTRVALWPALLLCSLLFGSVHVLNVFVTGQLFEAVVQATAATMSGLLFVALLIRTGSLWVPIAYHTLWDFFTFTMASGAAKGADAAEPTQGLAWLLPIALVTPNCLYGLYLLRQVRNDSQLSTD
jgi:uncharacterized protein